MKKLAKEREHDVQQELGSESFNICSTLFLDAIFGFDFPLLLPSLADAVGLSRKRMSWAARRGKGLAPKRIKCMVMKM